MQCYCFYKLQYDSCVCSYVDERKRELGLKTEEHKNNVKEVDAGFSIKKYLRENPTHHFDFSEVSETENQFWGQKLLLRWLTSFCKNAG